MLRSTSVVITTTGASGVDRVVAGEQPDRSARRAWPPGRRTSGWTAPSAASCRRHLPPRASARSIANSATTVLPLPVGAATNTDSPSWTAAAASQLERVQRERELGGERLGGGHPVSLRATGSRPGWADEILRRDRRWRGTPAVPRSKASGCLQVRQVPGAGDLHQAGIAVMVDASRPRPRPGSRCRRRRSRSARGRRSLRGRAWSRSARPCHARRPRSTRRAASAIEPRTCSQSSSEAWSLQERRRLLHQEPVPLGVQAVGQRASALRGLRRVGARSRVREDEPRDPLASHPPELEGHVAAHRQSAHHEPLDPRGIGGLQATVGGGAHRHRGRPRRRCRRTRAARAPPPAILRPRGSSPDAPTCAASIGNAWIRSTPSADSVIGSLSLGSGHHGEGAGDDLEHGRQRADLFPVRIHLHRTVGSYGDGGCGRQADLGVRPVRPGEHLRERAQEGGLRQRFDDADVEEAVARASASGSTFIPPP